jgi:capsular exopolysaccharide synthesis family protein
VAVRASTELTASAREDRALGTGAAPPDWQRTGRVWRNAQPPLERELGLRDLVRILKRRWRFIVGFVTIVTALVTFNTMQQAPTYTASVSMMLEPRRSQVVDVRQVISALPLDEETMRTETEVIRSRKLVVAVAEKLKLYDDPEFNPELRSPGWFARAWRAATQAAYDVVGGRASAKEADRAEQAELSREQVVESLSRALDVRSGIRSRILTISVSSESPKKAATIANAFTDVYVASQLEEKYEATRRATTWLNERLIKLRAEVEAAERAVEDYRKQHGLVRGKDSTTISSQQLSELNSQLIVARSKKVEAEARLSQVEDLVKSKRGVTSVAEVVSNQLIQRLLEQESEVLRKMADMAADFGPRHPRMIRVQSELADLRAKIRVEVQKVIDALRSEVAIAVQRERGLVDQLHQVEARLTASNATEVQLRALERDAQASRAVLEAFLGRFRELSGTQGLQAPDASVISAATPPLTPSAPRVKLVAVVAFFASALFALGIVGLREYFDASVHTLEDIETKVGISPFGFVPEATGKNVFRRVYDSPLSRFSECVRNVAIGISFLNPSARTIMVTSAFPGEGKSTLALSLAMHFAKQERRVLLIDADVRKPSLHSALGVGVSPGLSDLIYGAVSDLRAIRQDAKSSVAFVTAGTEISQAATIVPSIPFSEFLDRARALFDIIIVDTGAVLSVSDARAAARYVDAILFTVRWGSTSLDYVRHALGQFDERLRPIIGGVLSRVEPRAYARYSYEGKGYYDKRYGYKYYTS